MYGPKWPFSLRYRSRDTRRIDFPRVDGLLTDTPILGRHSLVSELRLNDYLGSSVGVFISMVLIPASQLGIRA